MRGIAAGGLAAHVGQQIMEIVHRRRALVPHQLVVLHGAQQLVDENERQLNLVGDFPTRAVAAGQQELQDERLDQGLRQAGALKRFRLRGQELVHPSAIARRGLRSGRFGRRRRGRPPCRGPRRAADPRGQRLDPLDHGIQALLLAGAARDCSP